MWETVTHPVVSTRQFVQKALQVEVGQVEKVGLRGGSGGGHRGSRGELAGDLLSSVEQRAGCCLLIASRAAAQWSPGLSSSPTRQVMCAWKACTSEITAWCLGFMSCRVGSI